MDDFAKKLEVLISNAKVSPDVIAKNIGISTMALWKLRAGRTTNPGIDTVQAICKYFQVEPNYFFEVDPSAIKASEVMDEHTRMIAMRTKGMDDKDKELALGMVEYILSFKSTKKRAGRKHDESKQEE